MMMKPHLVTTIPPPEHSQLERITPQAEPTSADTSADPGIVDSAVPSAGMDALPGADSDEAAAGEAFCAEELAATGVGDADDPCADSQPQSGTDQSQFWRQEPTASKEARWIVHVEVCPTGSTEPSEHRAFVYPQRVTFGRGESCDIQFAAAERTVSSLHAELVRTDSGYVLRDANSRNGLFLQGQGAQDPSHGPVFAGSPQQPEAASPIQLSELPLEVSAQPTEILLGPQGPACRIRIGDVIPFADYLVTGRLGEGGMATVFVAQETTGLGRLVVLKLIAPSLLMSIDQKDAQAMLQEEARIASQISHPNVVNIFRAGCYQGSHYIAMEYLRGVNFGSVQRQLIRRRRRCPADLAAALVSQALLGLHAAHEAKDASGRSLGIVHRDFTPTNIVCSPDGDVKLIDFGVARAIGRCYLSSTGQFVGKPAYASPEQIQRPKSIDRRSDVFAAGIILYELCTGQPLFLRDHDFATMAAVISEPIPPLTGIPDTLAQLITRALSRDPDDRPPTAYDLAEQLERFVLAEGGRYLQRKRIAQNLRRLGVNLLAPLPRTLVGRPTLFPQPKRILRSSRPPRAAQSEFDTAAAGPASPSALEELPTRQDPAAGLPQQLLLGGISYGITVCLKPPSGAVAPTHAEYLVAPTAPPDSPEAAPQLHRLHVIGGGAISAPPPEPYLGRIASLVQAWRQADPATCCLGPLLWSGPAWPGGPFAILLPTEQGELSLQALLLQPSLTWSTRITVAQHLARALGDAMKLQPGFVHGELSPAQVLVCTQPEPRVWLHLPEHLAGVLGQPPARAVASEGDTAGSLLGVSRQSACAYRAPECHDPSHNTPSSDVFSLAAMVFELLGGDLVQAAHAVRSGSRLPPLPPNHRASVATLDALRAALSPEPGRRPILSELARCLGAPADTAAAAAQPPSEPLLELPLPAPESRRSVLRADGGRMHLYALQLDHFANRGPFPLPLGPAAGPLLAPVRVALYRSTLAVDLPAENELGQARLRLYQDGAESGKARLFLESDATAFELGNRTQNLLQRIEYQAPADEAQDTAVLAPLALKVQLLRRGRAAFLWLRDLRSGDQHVCCIQIAA